MDEAATSNGPAGTAAPDGATEPAEAPLQYSLGEILGRHADKIRQLTAVQMQASPATRDSGIPEMASGSAWYDVMDAEKLYQPRTAADAFYNALELLNRLLCVVEEIRLTTHWYMGQPVHQPHRMHNIQHQIDRLRDAEPALKALVRRMVQWIHFIAVAPQRARWINLTLEMVPRQYHYLA